MREDIILQGKWKIVGVDNTTEEEGNGYQDMPIVGADVDLPLFEEGVEPTYVRLDHDQALIVPQKYLLYLNFIVIDVWYYGYNYQRNKWYHRTAVTIQFFSCYDNTSIRSNVPVQLYPSPNMFHPSFFDSSRPSVCT